MPRKHSKTGNRNILSVTYSQNMIRLSKYVQVLGNTGNINSHYSRQYNDLTVPLLQLNNLKVERYFYEKQMYLSTYSREIFTADTPVRIE